MTTATEAPYELFDCDTEEEWLDVRRQGIGASDAPKILGQSRFGGPLAVYADKLGVSDPAPEGGPAYWGHRLERVVAEEYSKQAQRSVFDPGEYTIYRSIQCPWMQTTLDRTFSNFSGTVQGNLQIKTTGAYMAAYWDDGPPIDVSIQVQHELAVTGREMASIAVLIGGNDFRWFDVPRNQKFIDVLIPTMQEFWNRVQAKNQPDLDASPNTGDLLRRLHPQDNGAEIILPAAADKWGDALVNAKDTISAAQEIKLEAENRIKAAIGDATFGVTPGGARYSWRTQTRKAHEVKESTSRTLRRLKEKTK